jgi:hypothetical protein
MKKNKFPNKFLFYCVLTGIGFALLTSACKQSKSTVSVALSPKSKNERLDLFINQALQYETFSSQLNFTFQTKKQSVSVDGQLKMIKDRAIQLSLKIPLLGTEAFRITLTPDQLIIIDRINKQYLAESMSEIQSKAPFDFDFYSFQALLSNRLFIAGKNQITPDDYPLFRMQEDFYLFHIENTDRHNIEYSFTGDFTHRILKTQMRKEEWNSKIECVYDRFGLTDNKKLFPMSLKMELNLPEEAIQINLNFYTVNINGAFELDYGYPAKYKPVSLQDIIKLIQNMS